MASKGKRLFILVSILTVPLLCLSWHFIVNKHTFSASSKQALKDDKVSVARTYSESLKEEDLDGEEPKSVYRMGELHDEAKPDRNNSVLIKLGDVVQRRIESLQNPTDCSQSKKIYCVKTGVCGMGCILSHYLPCLYLGYYTKRTVILELDIDIFRYTGGYDKWFYPVTSCAVSTPDLDSVVDIGVSEGVFAIGKVNDSHPLWYWKHDKSKNKYVYPVSLYGGFYRTLPDDLQIVKKYTREPETWFAGQFLKYLLARWRPHLKEQIEERTRAIGYKHPIFAMHVRRSMDWRRSMTIPLKQFMSQAENYYNENFPDISERRVFLAADKNQTLQSLLRDYPQYKFIHQGKYNVMSAPAKTTVRQNEQSLLGLLVDVKLLADADELLVTLDSNFGMMACQLRMATWHYDVVDHTKSIENTMEWRLSLYFEGETAMLLVVKDFNSTGAQDMNIKVGDLIIDPLIYYNWDSMNSLMVYSRGRKYSTSETGRYPISHVVRYPEESLKYLFPKHMLSWD